MRLGADLVHPSESVASDRSRSSAKSLAPALLMALAQLRNDRRRKCQGERVPVIRRRHVRQPAVLEALFHLVFRLELQQLRALKIKIELWPI